MFEFLLESYEFATEFCPSRRALELCVGRQGLGVFAAIIRDRYTGWYTSAPGNLYETIHFNNGINKTQWFGFIASKKTAGLDHLIA